MIEQHRELLKPGDGIVRDADPTKEHQEFPRWMKHPGYQRGKPDQEIKVVDENGKPTGRLTYTGGESIRFPPVLVRSVAQRDEHLSYGYEDQGQADPAAFARLVADMEPVPENYKPLEYPKHCFGKIVNDKAEEDARLIELNINADGTPRTVSSEIPAAEPVLTTEVNTLEVFAAPVTVTTSAAVEEEDEIAALEAKLAALKEKKAQKDHFVRIPETDTHSAHMAYVPVVEENVTLQSGETVRRPAVEQPSDYDVVATVLAEQAAATKKKARSDAIKAGVARKKAEREAAKAQEGDKAA